MKRTTKAAISKYTKQICIDCYNLAEQDGMGARSIGEKFNLTTNQADAAINAGRELSTMESISKVPDFYGKCTSEIHAKYFPEVKYHRDDEKCAAVSYSLECFNNGGLSYELLIQQISKSCNDSKANIHAIVSKYLIFQNYVYDPSLPDIVTSKWPASMYNKKKL